jgi:hypothetical protein
MWMSNGAQALLVAYCAACSIQGFSQTHWEGVGYPLDQVIAKQLYVDPVDDALLVIGQSQPWNVDGQWVQGLCRLQDGVWDTMAVFDSDLDAVIRWGDTLIVTGDFQTVDQVAIAHIAAWYDSAWHPFGDLPTNGFIHRFRIIDGELYAVGRIIYFDGHLCNGVAKRIGGEWTNVGLPEYESWGYVDDIIRYQGQLAICGTISAPDHLGRDILVYDGVSSWPRLMETAVVGGLSAIRSMIVYQDDLVITGPIDVNGGNVGHSIQRWDGSSWHAMGSGLTFAPNDFLWIHGGNELALRDGLLYVAGGFYYAGGVPAKGMATWDGERWCGLGGDLDLVIRSMVWYHDTLYVCPEQYADGVDVNSVARYIGTYPDTCTQNSVWVPSLSVTTSMDLRVVLHGNAVEVRLPVGSAAQLITLFDAHGRTLGQASGTTVTIPSPSAAGIYLVRSEGFPPRKVFIGSP